MKLWNEISRRRLQIEFDYSVFFVIGSIFNENCMPLNFANMVLLSRNVNGDNGKMNLSASTLD